MPATRADRVRPAQQYVENLQCGDLWRATGKRRLRRKRRRPPPPSPRANDERTEIAYLGGALWWLRLCFRAPLRRRLRIEKGLIHGRQATRSLLFLDDRRQTAPPRHSRDAGIDFRATRWGPRPRRGRRSQGGQGRRTCWGKAQWHCVLVWPPRPLEGHCRRHGRRWTRPEGLKLRATRHSRGISADLGARQGGGLCARPAEDVPTIQEQLGAQGGVTSSHDVVDEAALHEATEAST